MGFSALAGLMGGMAHSAEQVLDRNLTRLDAAGVAKEKEAAQMRIEDHINSLKAGDEVRQRKAAIEEEARQQSDPYLAAKFRTEGQVITGSPKYAIERSDKEITQKREQQVADSGADTGKGHLLSGQAAMLTATNKTAGDKKLTHAEKMAEYKAGEKIIDVAFNASYNAFGMADPSTIKDKAGHAKALANLQRSVFGDGGLGAEIAEKITSKGLENQQANEARKNAFIEEFNNNAGFFTAKNSYPKNDDGSPIIPPDWKPKGTATPTPADHKAAGGAANIPQASLKGGEVKGGYVWDAKLGRAVPVQPKADATPSKPKSLMEQQPVTSTPTAPVTTTATVPPPISKAQPNPPPTPEVRPAGINESASPAAKEWEHQQQQKAIADEARRKTEEANPVAKPVVQSGASKLMGEFAEGNATRAAEARAKAKAQEAAKPADTKTISPSTKLENELIELKKTSTAATDAAVDKAYQRLLNSNLAQDELMRKFAAFAAYPSFVKRHPDAMDMYLKYLSKSRGSK